jgi:CBS domain-containing protein
MPKPRVADVMTRDIFAVAPDTSLETAARMLTNRRITGAPVVSTDGRAVGVVTLADLTDPDRGHGELDGYSMFYRVTDGWAIEVGDLLDPRPGRVEDVMTRSPLCTEESATIEEAARRLIAFGVHRLLVTKDGALVGIVTSIDLLRGFVEHV